MRQVVLIIVGVLMSVVACGASRSMVEAAVLAQQFADGCENHARKLSIRADVPMVRLVKQYMQEDNHTAALYVFNMADDAGYVIVSADDRTEDILGYSDSGKFDTTDVNPSFEWWMKRYVRQMAVLADTAPTIRKSSSVTTKAIFPMLSTTEWAQEAPYFNQCPKDLFTNETSLTGCVATAAAQIMYKWKYPEHGTGAHSYKWCQEQFQPYREDCKSLSLKYDTITFDWAHMKDSYIQNYTNREAQAVAALMYACGVACDMEYSSDGSGSFTDNMGYGLITYFDYTYTIFVSATSRSKYSNAKGNAGIKLSNCQFRCTISELESYLNSDLEVGRPVLMSGQDNFSGGHAFVCDGRDSSGKFHINWGWSGDENGYFTLTALGETYDFSDDIDMLIGLEPNVRTNVQEYHALDDIMPRKILNQGSLYIEYNGKMYDALGQHR